ncbi:MAG: CDP-alcohol phosphatidyltransferase family protein [Rubricella sp.]
MRRFLNHALSLFHRRAPFSTVLSITPLGLEFFLSSLCGVLVTLLIGLRAGGEAGALLATGLFCIGATAAAYGMRRSYDHAAMGLCNVITLARLALTAALAAFLFQPAPAADEALWFVFAVAVTTLLLDGVDGWAARRAGLASRFGARFDMEVDSLFALLLALLAFRMGQAGAWVILLGLPRYLFMAAGHLWPWLGGDLPDRFSRKVVCVFQIGVLVAMFVPMLPGALLDAAAIAVALALGWSFHRDVRWLMSTAR